MTKIIVIILATLITQFGNAQVPVKYEPHHHNVFENEYIRLLDVHIGPGDTTQFHEHNTPSVFFTFTTTKTTSQLIGQPPSRVSNNRPGPPSYDSLGTPRIHRVWNNDSVWFQVMDIELLKEKPTINPAILDHSSLTIAFNRYLANGYRMQLKPSEKIELPISQAGYLVVSQVDATVDYTLGNVNQKRFMKPGHFIWIPQNQNFSITNTGEPASFMILQLK
ncbi:MAG TPA: hypothetical protein PLY70_13680 [Saprospiraceae bacterium]|nr:hypothetical protein [Saprospiraceae bacterium]HPN71446.1 hypothetical protein [Saprospiraceae bacterium]